MPAPEEMLSDELIVVVARQAERLAAQERQIAEMVGQLAQLMEVNEALAEKLARLEHLLSRNSGNSSSPPSRDDDPGKPAAPEKKRDGGNPARARGKQPGAPGSHLAWTADPYERRDRFPQGRCDCGNDLAERGGSGGGRLLPVPRDPADLGAGHPVRPAPSGVLRMRTDPRRGPTRRGPTRAGRLRAEPGRVRGVPHGRSGLIDEYALATYPVLVGGGTPFFTALDSWVNLNLVETRTFPGGVALTRYETRR